MSLGPDGVHVDRPSIQFKLWKTFRIRIRLLRDYYYHSYREFVFILHGNVIANLHWFPCFAHNTQLSLLSSFPRANMGLDKGAIDFFLRQRGRDEWRCPERLCATG